MTKKPLVIRKSSTKSRTKKPMAIKLVHAKRPVLKHFKLVEHKHTGKLLHFRHSSYVALMGILLVLGFFLVISQNMTRAESVTIGAIVQAPPPTVGATITSPVDGFTIVNINPSVVSGTCLPDSFVTVYNDGSLSSSNYCTSAGVFSVNVQLHAGKNVLTARNFDAINQAGPDTPAVTVTFSADTPTTEVTVPKLPVSPLVIPGVSTITTGTSAECADYQQSGALPVGGEPHVAVVCVPRIVAVTQDHTIGVLVWGGSPPYALDFKWGSGDTTLVSLDQPGYKAVNVHYASSGIYNIDVQLTDHGSKAATGESAVQVTGTSSQPLAQVVNNILSSSWFETPVPLYLSAVGVTLGFWGGDIFNRFFGARTARSKVSNYMRK
jgi:hypothetical protein